MATFCLTEEKVEGEMKLWYPVTITFDGPKVGEEGSTFRDYRLDVTFSVHV